jgi:methionine aminopeptidase
MLKKSKTIQLKNGDIVAFKVGQSFNFVCCDCGLTHHIKTGKINKENRITLKITRVV